MIDRLDRIETLHLSGAPAAALLGELRALLGEAEDWLAVEQGETDRVSDALDRCRDALAVRESAPAS